MKIDRVIDHIKPLACGGPDDPTNIQWQTVAEAKAKDKTELKDCARDELAGYPKGHSGGHDPNGIVLRGSSNATREQARAREEAEHPE